MQSNKFFGLAFSFLLLANTFFAVTHASASSKGLESIEYSTVIKGTAEEVWDAITNFEDYGKWNQFTVRLEGEPELGAYVKAYVKSGRHLDLEITSFLALKEICWVDVTWFTHFGVGGWRCRSIKELPNGKGVLFVNHFQYTGTFGRALEYVTLDFLKDGMQLENANLKDYIEAQ